jgi:hypothetical protein
LRPHAPFDAGDLRDLDDLLAKADAVVSMREINEGAGRGCIGLRHDVDNVFTPCVELAEWEAERGYQATYFILHDTTYWNSPELRPGLERIAELGHEIALHTNAITTALTTGRCPHETVAGALDRLRYWGHDVVGVVAHGDPLCYKAGFVNDESFVECARPEMGAPNRTLHDVYSLTLEPRPLASFGLEYDANRLSRSLYLSDSGGRWSLPFDEASAWDPADGQLHILVHPCWWTQAFVGVMARG